MKTSRKIILVTAFLGTLGLSGLARAETNDGAKEQTEAASLHSLAKITPQQAQKAAETVQKGRASRVKLENENGNLVYAVTIGQQELLVDAGNGRVLSSSNPNTEQNEGLQTRSSIQVSHPSDGDGETNDAKEK